MNLNLFAATITLPDWSAIVPVLWTVASVIYHVLLVVGVVTAAILGIIALAHTRRGKAIVQAVEKDVKVAAVDTEAVVAGVLKGLGKDAAPVAVSTVPNDPLVAAAIEVYNARQGVSERISKARAGVASAEEALTAPAAAKAVP